MQRDRGVVGMADTALDVNAWVPADGAPAPALRLQIAGQDHLVLRLGHSVRVTRADVDRLTAGTVAEVGPMRLAAVATGQRLVPQHQLLVRSHIAIGQEEPFALTEVSGVLAPAASLGLESLAGLGRLHLGGLEGFLGLTNGADRSLLRDASDEPVALIMAAQELALFLALTNEQKQVPVVRLNIE